jgi:hypothetical protein
VLIQNDNSFSRLVASRKIEAANLIGSNDRYNHPHGSNMARKKWRGNTYKSLPM